MTLLIAAAAWGFAEATVFFFVPDILLTYIVLKHGLKKALLASLCAVGGAVIGGILMYWWGARAEESVLAFLERIPAIGADMFATVHGHLYEHGVMGLFKGTANGIPYKIYAVKAHGAGIDWWAFALMSIPARLYRFVIASVLTAGIAYLLRGLSDRTRYGLLAGFWIVSYTVYFYNFMD